jgi:HEAT repeat protein
MRISLAAAANVVFLGGAITLAFGAGEESESQQIAKKQAKLRSVVAELTSRDTSQLSVEKREARTRALALLSAYGERGQFTIHHEEWPRTKPLFIDEFGTRCALASVLDGFGEDAVVQRLAVECNDAYVAEIPDDPEIARCLDELGLTIDEAAYIQDPGGHRYVDRGPDPGPRGGGSKDAGNDVAPKPSEKDDVAPSRDDDANRYKSADPMRRPDAKTPGKIGPTAPPTGGGARGGGTTGARRSSVALRFRWTDWWYAHRDEFVNVRARFHDSLPRTPGKPGERANRPSAEEIRRELLPLFAELARNDANLRSTALGMWARGADPKNADDAAAVRAAVLEFLADPNQRDRGWGPVLFAILADPATRAPLAELVSDSAAGRKLLSQTSAVSEEMRALAAVAYGRCGGPIDVLTSTLADSPAAHEDLASACVVAIGLSSRDPAQHVGAVTFLLKELEHPTLPAAALAQVPGALQLAQDPVAVPALFAVVSRFRGPRELRRACALALGETAPELDESVREALAALARRDVDSECRHAAIIALGVLVARQGSTASAETVAQLIAFHEDALAGRFRHDDDLAWHALSAGLFLRGRPNDGATVRPALRAIASKASDASLRAAACLALGLAQDVDAAPILTDTLARGNEEMVACAAEALGLAGIGAARAPLLDLCLSSPSESVGFAAASALACLADPSSIGPLLAAFDKTPSAAVRAGLAAALGEIGDRSAIDELRRVALDPTRDLPSRDRALSALGAIAQAGDLPWTAPIQQAIDSGAATPSLRLLLGLF